MLELIIAVIIGGLLLWMVFGKQAASANPIPPPQPSAQRAAPAAEKRKKVQILFGSQTGTAELFAKTLLRQGTKLGVPCQMTDLEEYTAHHLCDEALVIFVVATYGEGEPTDSMKSFHDWLMESADQEDLTNVKYTVFGLGDRQYKHFCQMGVDCDTKMDELGAKRIYGLGQGDAGRDIEEEFDTWSQDLWPAVGAALGIEIKADSDEASEPELVLKYFDQNEAAFPFPKMATAMEPTQRLPVYGAIAENKELLTDSSERSTRSITFDIGDTLISYQAGDHLGILPQNPASVVDDYIKRLGVEDSAKVMSLQDKSFKNVFPARVSIRTALTWYVDLCGVPKKSTLRTFAHYCKDESQKKEFLSLLQVSKDSQNAYHAAQRKVRNVLGFLNKFDSCEVPLGHFLEVMPRMAPRYFSIASDQLQTPKTIGVTVAHVANGVCTTMLRDAEVGAKFPMFVRKSNFHLPLRHKTRPLIMIGPGTGVAPLIGFCHRRLAWKAKNQELGEAILFFGCRNESEDYIYADFLKQCLGDGILTSLDVAFSRQQQEKVYVQHRIRARDAEMWKLISGGANVYICGDAKHMAKDVESTLKDIIVQHGSMTPGAAEEYLDKMEKNDRFLKDVWSA